MSIHEKLQRLEEMGRAAEQGGGADRIKAQHDRGKLSARERLDLLLDEGSFVEHGQLVLTPGTGLPRDEVISKFPTDGMVTGVGSINGDLFSGEVTPIAQS